jgi:hypothetical protein
MEPEDLLPCSQLPSTGPYPEARPQVVDGGDILQIWRVAVNILNKSWTADKGWSSRLGIGRGAKTPRRKK